jgi:hypothetical protein
LISGDGGKCIEGYSPYTAGGRMTECPYPETIQDEDSSIEVYNDQYKYWHEGYEAHKFEMANLSIQLASMAQELEDEIRDVKVLKSELEKQRAKFEKTN